MLLSIQSMILVDQPWFNEPGADALQGTAEGAAKSRAYNEELQVILNLPRQHPPSTLRPPRRRSPP